MDQTLEAILAAGVDLVNGRPLPDTEDEPVRQLTEKLLLDLGHAKERIGVDASRSLALEGRELTVVADLLVSLAGRAAMVLHCRRGSLISREREAVAIARLISEHLAPLTVVTNSEDAEIIDAASGQVIARGIGSIPGPAELARHLAGHPPRKTPDSQYKQAARIYEAYFTLQCHWQCET